MRLGLGLGGVRSRGGRPAPYGPFAKGFAWPGICSPGGRYRSRPVSSVIGTKPAACSRRANLALRLRVTRRPMPKIAMKISQAMNATM